MKKILVIGSINIDLVTNVKVTPRVGETVFGNKLMEFPGGKGANQAAAIGRLGGNVTLLGKVGSDSYGDFMIKAIEKSGVKTDFIQVSADNHTGTALIMVNEDGDNSIVVIPGANFDISKEQINESLINEFDIIIGQLEVSEEILINAFEIANKLGKTTILNPAPAKILDDKLLKNVSILIPNETELEVLTDININTDDDIKKAYEKLRTIGTKELIVTLGTDGSVYLNDDEFRRFKALKVDAIDTTAAGDSFIGGVTVMLSEGNSIDEAISFGSKVASITVTRMGAQSSLPFRKEVE